MSYSCANHAGCSSVSGRYCAAVVNSTNGSCRQCEECAQWSDAIDSVCPSSCASANVGSNSSTTAEELYNAYGYWSRVRDEGRDVIADGCLKSAEEATRVTSGALKGRKGGCAPVFTKKAVSRWCQLDELTLRYPFNSCIATASNDYCGVGEKAVCVANSYYDCCPLQKGVVAGVSIAVGIVLIIVNVLICRSCYTRKLIKRMDVWSDPAVKQAAMRASMKHPKLSMRIRGAAPAPAPAPAPDQP
ncbi:hypothetical protein BE221DRAFT_188963 [Ostreococcus tauri]|uniref:Uncharacterized protein n=1 Tax=Ostreococcus tauri TaxID=70448 RepID=A0A1Y5INE6_OSTTA|nr:hypothetical protein BE221DRAFT_188963 [Ostreococcus tauri]